MRGHESKEARYCRKGKGGGGGGGGDKSLKRQEEARQQNTPSVEDRAVETLAAFFRACLKRHVNLQKHPHVVLPTLCAM